MGKMMESLRNKRILLLIECKGRKIKSKGENKDNKKKKRLSKSMNMLLDKKKETKPKF